MKMMEKQGIVTRWLNSNTTLKVLLVLNLLQVLGIMWATRNVVLSDTWSYLALAEGLLHGNYSMWWQLPIEIPDTFRAPGYPLVLATVIKVFGNYKVVKVINFLLYCAGVFLSLAVIKRFDTRPIARNIFLILLIPSINIPYYVMQAYTDIPTLFGICAVVFIATRPGRLPWYLALVQGLLFAILFQLKPVFLLLPLVYYVAMWLVERKKFQFRTHALSFSIFVVSLLPFGFWNLQHHGIFQVTPLQGGGGYMHFGFWCGKMPNYTDHISLRNFTGDEVFDFVPPSTIPANIQEFESEWADILAIVDPLKNRTDSIMLTSRPLVSYTVENTFNSEYTRTREKLLMDKAVGHMLDDPWYTIKYKVFSAVRLWVIGIQVTDFREASMLGKLQMLYASITTGIIFTLMMIVVPLAIWRKRLRIAEIWPLAILVGYTWLIHVPFTIQSRYTICVRFTMMALVAIAIASLWSKSEDPRAPIQ